MSQVERQRKKKIMVTARCRASRLFVINTYFVLAGANPFNELLDQFEVNLGMIDNS